MKELESIVDYEVFPSVDAAFHQSATCTGCTDMTAAACSCTQSSYYWSSTTYQVSPPAAWLVVFGAGDVTAISKLGTSYVRAVRGGS